MQDTQQALPEATYGGGVPQNQRGGTLSAKGAVSAWAIVQF